MSAPCTAVAQRFLASAYDTVADLLSALDVVRTSRKASEGRGFRGRLTGPEEDLLRAGLAFAGAGLDASLKQVARDALPVLLADSESPASAELITFASRQIGVQQLADPVRIAALLVTENPRRVLVAQFVEEMTGASIQSVAALHKIASVLGMPKKHPVRVSIDGLRPAFAARNQVAHELDLQVPLGSGDRQKRNRTLSGTIPLMHALLDVPQKIINEVATLLA